MENRYAGTCAGCGQHVAAYDGIYDWGVLTCGETDSSTLEESGQRAYWAWLPTVAPASCPALFARFVREQMTPDAIAERAAAAAAELAALDALRESWRVELVDGGKLAALAVVARVRSLDAVIVKVCGAGATLAGLSWADAVAVRDELQQRAERRERAATNKANGGADCRKCSGSGSFWQMTAGGQWADGGCWRCHGSGKEPRRGGA
jgi:hypothetical protein